MAREIMPHDAEVFGNQFPAYRANPMAETLRAIQTLASDPGYARRYAEFHQDMVYGSQIDYAACIDTLKEWSYQLRGGR